MDEYRIPDAIKVLHIEDSKSDIVYVKGILENIADIKFTVLQAGTLKEGIDAFRHNRDTDIILLDLTLPDVQGIDTLVKMHMTAPETAIVMITGEGDEKTILEGLRREAQDYISKKEIRPDLLKRVIVSAIDRYRSHCELTSSEQRFQLAVTGTFDGIWDWFIIKHELWLSEQFYNLLGYEEGEFPPTLANWKDCFHSDDRKALLRGIQRHLQEQDIAYHSEHRMRTKDGEFRWFLVRGQAVWNHKGDPVRMAGSISDIHDRKRMEDELTRSEERYFLAVRGAGVGLWDWDITTDEMFWTDKYKRMLGVTYKIFRPERSFWDERIHPEDLPKVKDAMQSHLKDGTQFDIQYRMRHEDGRYIWVQARGQADWEDDGTPSRMAGSVADITELKKAEEESTNFEMQLRHSQKLEAIGQLAAGIAHEINTPSQFVGDNTRFFQDSFGDIASLLELYQQLLDTAEKKEDCSDIVDQVKEKIDEVDLEYLLEEIPQAAQQSLDGVARIRDIVKAMKEFSHPGSASKELSDINKNIENTVTVSRNEWKYVSEVETDLDPDLPQVECLPNELNQVVLNMIVNASHAIKDIVGDSGELGKITIGTRLVEDQCEITIQDSGKGMPDDVKDRVFDPFFTTKEVGKGTGQGLAIAYSVVVDKHFGTVNVESEEGKGTKFIIQLPISAPKTGLIEAVNDEGSDGDEKTTAVC